MIGKTWQWWQLWLKIKPTLRSAKFAEIKVCRMDLLTLIALFEKKFFLFQKLICLMRKVDLRQFYQE